MLNTVSPELRTLVVGDDPAAWEAAGFRVQDGETAIGSIAVRFVAGPDSGVVGLEFDGVEDGPIDGLPATGTTALPAEPVEHPNGVSRMDHVVVMTPDLERTTAALEQAGFSVRRTREVLEATPPRRQAFLWAGETILEVVGPVTPSGTGPASIWGLALTTDDLPAAVELLEDRLTTPKPAVQPGREIATVKTGDIGVSLALALMTAHVDPKPLEQSDA
ncbi:MAG: VOC family protein [Acidobacteriota bacterium]